jgi:hypothetical protein
MYSPTCSQIEYGQSFNSQFDSSTSMHHPPPRSLPLTSALTVVLGKMVAQCWVRGRGTTQGWRHASTPYHSEPWLRHQVFGIQNPKHLQWLCSPFAWWGLRTTKGMCTSKRPTLDVFDVGLPSSFPGLIYRIIKPKVTPLTYALQFAAEAGVAYGCSQHAGRQ